ncbi:MAG: carbohydrate binding domain-containing protein [Myxococcota bacterium]
MLVALFTATAFSGAIRHVVHVDVDVPTPTRAVSEGGSAERGEAEAMALPGVRTPRRAATEGDVPLRCSSQSADGAFVAAHDAHRPRLFLRDGTVWFERQVSQYPESLDQWPSLSCAWEDEGRMVEYAINWVPLTPEDICRAKLAPAQPAKIGVLQNFERGLPASKDPTGIPLGFSTFNDPDSTSSIETTTNSPRRPGASRGNDVMKLDLDVKGFAGVVYLNPNEAGDTWTAVDMSEADGISFWFYGRNSGNNLYFHLLDDRHPCSTTDDAERWTFPFVDDFEGWKQFEASFADFDRVAIERETPDNGLGLSRVHGWAIGALKTNSAQSYFLDEIELYRTE